MLRFTRLLGLVCLVGTALFPMTARAQGSPALQRVEVAMWPEYDQRAMLLIYRLTLPTETALPAEVQVPIPARVGEPGAVAQKRGDGALVLADYTREATAGDWAVLTIRAESQQLQVEFYDALEIEGNQRMYTLTWPAGSPVGDLAFEVQQPFGAESMHIDPAPADVRVGADGLMYHTGTLGAQDGTKAAVLQVDYTATASGLTVDSLPVAMDETPALGEPEGTRPTSLWLDWAPWLIGGLGATLLVVVAVIFLRTRREAGGVRRPRHRPSGRRDTDSPAIDASAVFCHSCGTQARVSDVFCRKCGTRLRS